MVLLSVFAKVYHYLYLNLNVLQVLFSSVLLFFLFHYYIALPCYVLIQENFLRKKIFTFLVIECVETLYFFISVWWNFWARRFSRQFSNNIEFQSIWRDSSRRRIKWYRVNSHIIYRLTVYYNTIYRMQSIIYFEKFALMCLTSCWIFSIKSHRFDSMSFNYGGWLLHPVSEFQISGRTSETPGQGSWYLAEGLSLDL